LGLTVNGAVVALWIISGVSLGLWIWALISTIRAGALPSGVTRTLVTEGRISGLEEGLIKVLSSQCAGGGACRMQRIGDGIFEVGAGSEIRMRAVPCFDSCRIDLRPLDDRQVRVMLNFDYSTVRRKALGILKILLAVALLLIVGLAVVLGFTVTGSDSASVRVQAIQAVHAIHFIWPCWLVAGIYRRSRKATDTFMDSAVANASVLAEAYERSRTRSGQ
jgi:hypothetical protein